MKRRIGFLFPPGFQALDLMATTVFEIANGLDGGPVYDMTMLSEHGGVLSSSSGVGVFTEAFDRRDYDTLIVAGIMTPVGF